MKNKDDGGRGILVNKRGVKALFTVSMSHAKTKGTYLLFMTSIQRTELFTLLSHVQKNQVISACGILLRSMLHSRGVGICRAPFLPRDKFHPVSA